MEQINPVKRRLVPVCLVSLLALSPMVHAVVINSETGTGNTNAPADDPGWANVGVLNGASGVYLGAGWVLTAAHVGVGNISFAGVSYSALTNTLVQLTNSAPGKSVLTDLIMFQLASTPAGLGPLTLASTAPVLGAGVTMIGAGRDRGAFTEWSVVTTNSPWTWTEVPSGGNAAGYQTLADHSMRWGTNSITTANLWVSDGIGDVKSFVTEFDAAAGPDEAQAVLGDSGGAVFTKNGSAWELGGMMFAVGGYSGQPPAGETPVYGNATYSADISSYATQIMSIIPEPSIYSLLVFSAAAAGLVRWRKSKQGS